MEAETLRLSHRMKRTIARGVLGCIALALLLGALGFGHVAAWYWLRDFMAARYVALMFAGCDLLLALLLAILAARSVPGPVEREALALRRRALDDAVASLSVSALLIRLVDQVIRRRPRR